MKHYSAIYTQPKTFGKFSEGKIIGYLNEKIIPDYLPQDAKESVIAYQYTGPEKDGGTIMPCDDPTTYPDVVNAIIRSKYTESEEMAIHRHHGNDPEGYAEEWQLYNRDCEDAKSLAKTWLKK